MTLASPLFLLLLIPLAALAAYMMSHGGSAVEVPSTRFWPANSPKLGARWRWGRLPAWIVLALAGSLAAILAAAGPGVGGRYVRPVTLIVDRGVTMSAGYTNDTATRLVSVSDSLSIAADRAGIVPVRAVAAPGGLLDVGASVDETARSDWRRLAVRRPPTPFDTRQSIAAAAAAELAQADRAVVVATDQPIELTAGRLAVVRPFHVGSDGLNVGIVHIGASPSPPRVLVRIRASAAIASVSVRVTSGDASAEKVVDVPAPPGEQDVVLELPEFGDVIEARIAVAGDILPADDAAWLTRASSWPRVEARPGVSADLARLIETYGRVRPADEHSPIVHVGADAPPDSAGVWVRAPAGDDVAAIEGVVQVSGTIGGGIDWRGLLADARVGAEPDASWRSIVSVNGRTLIAERDAPARQVMVNVTSPTFSRRPEFVVLFGQIFDSFVNGSIDRPAWSSMPITEVPAVWQLVTPPVAGLEPSPGVYRDRSGGLHALNVATVELPELSDTDWQAALRAIPGITVGGWPVDSVLASVAAVLILAAAAVGAISRRRRVAAAKAASA